MSVKYGYGENNEFILEGYDRAKTFAGFLPGIAGVNGIPMWAFYVNRGQAMGSFGVRDKNGAIMEFFPANTMCRNIERQGFRTFVRKGSAVHELFSSVSQDDCTRKMVIEKNRIRIEEENRTLSLQASVTYFTLPGEGLAAVVRKAEFRNLASRPQEIEILDGLPQILPFGVTNAGYQAMSNLMKSWLDVYHTGDGFAFYKVRASVGDTEEVREVREGNFYLAFSSESDRLLSPIFDMDVIFGANTSLSKADGWDCPVEELLARRQTPQNKVSGGFTGVRTNLAGQFTLYSLVGHAAGPELILDKAGSFTPEYVKGKEEAAVRLAEELVENTRTHTASPLFDEYISQCNLDNTLRGGYPLILGAEDRKHTFHVFSRKHGDLEREYNFFSLEPGFYSQGDGNFRDVNQNRRSDVLLNPAVGDADVKQFLNLMQADGYNPLLVKGCTFTVDSGALTALMEKVSSGREEVEAVLRADFTPGQLMDSISGCKDSLAVGADAFLNEVLKNSRRNFVAEFGEGYWTDHWTYNLDLVAAYLTVYPDRKEELLYGDATYRFYKSPVHILPRSEKYVLAGDQVRQYGAVLAEGNRAGTDWLRTGNGAGGIYETNLFSKLLALALVKFASLDPFGMGIEMEAGKPGWNDALNGLPGLFGSGLSETAELSRLVAFLADACGEADREIPLFAEASGLLSGILPLLEENLQGQLNEFTYWDRVSCLREAYRAKVRSGIAGAEEHLRTGDLLHILGRFTEKLDIGLQKSLQYGGGVYPTYLTYRATGYEPSEGRKNPVNGLPAVRVTGFECAPLPLFLEGPARVMKTMARRGAESLYNAVKASGIYDGKLGMYKTSEPLGEASQEIGRLKAFTPGWLERESVFLHMEYKYLYAMLKAGLYEQFFKDMKTALIPFLRPETYGRSTLENSSFIASSVNPDESLYGRGFVARLTGSTAEMLSMWFTMMAGMQPFAVEGGELTLKLDPILPGWLFDDEGCLGFTFLGHTKVTYFNERRHDTFGENGARPLKYVLRAGAETHVIYGPALPSPFAEAVRAGEIKGIDVYLH